MSLRRRCCCCRRRCRIQERPYPWDYGASDPFHLSYLEIPKGDYSIQPSQVQSETTRHQDDHQHRPPGYVHVRRVWLLWFSADLATSNTRGCILCFWLFGILFGWWSHVGDCYRCCYRCCRRLYPQQQQQIIIIIFVVVVSQWSAKSTKKKK